MIVRGRTALLLGGLLALGCDDEVRASFDLDSIDEPDEDCVVVVHERLELGEVLHEYVADSPSSTGGWALVTVVDDPDLSGLALVRVPASPDEPETPPIGLGATSLNSARVELRPGTSPGELWMLVDWGTSALLRKLAPGVGPIVSNPSIGNFPIHDGVGCPPGATCCGFAVRLTERAWAANAGASPNASPRAYRHRRPCHRVADVLRPFKCAP